MKNKKTTPNEKIEQIIQNQYHKKSQSLNLSGYGQQWRDVIFSKDWKMIKKLILGQECDINRNDARMIANLQWPNLRTLAIQCDPSQSVIKQLMNNQWPKLNVLQIGGSKISNESFYQLLKCLSNKLKKLILEGNQLKGQAISYMKQFRFDKLRQLNLSGNIIGSLGCKYLSKVRIPELEDLNLQGCSIQTEGIKHLLKGDFYLMRNLNLRFNQINLNGYQAFQIMRWRNLQQIMISDLVLYPTFAIKSLEIGLISFALCSFVFSAVQIDSLQNRQFRDSLNKIKKRIRYDPYQDYQDRLNEQDMFQFDF